MAPTDRLITEYAVQVNGKLTEYVSVASGLSASTVKGIVEVRPKVKERLKGRPVAKAIFVQDRYINLATDPDRVRSEFGTRTEA